MVREEGGRRKEEARKMEDGRWIVGGSLSF
jgi:hypothetical protein